MCHVVMYSLQQNYVYLCKDSVCVWKVIQIFVILGGDYMMNNRQMISKFRFLHYTLDMFWYYSWKSFSFYY